MKTIKTIKKVNIVDEVYEQMKDFITDGVWEPGSKIPSENELSRLFNVSRNTVRSAISKLKAVGVLTTRQGQGTFICKSVVDNIVDSIVPIAFLSKEGIIEIMEFRKPLEIESAGLAAIRHDEEDIDRMQETLELMERNLDNYKEHANADYKFHLLMARGSKNRIIYRTLIKLKDVIYTHFEKMSKDLGGRLSIDNHKKIFEAIKNRDNELARYLVKENIENSINILKSK